MSNSHKCWQNQQEKTQEKFRRLRLHELCRKSLHRWKMVKVYISLSTDENVSCDVWIWDIVDGRIIIGEGRENRNRSPSFPTDGRGRWTESSDGVGTWTAAAAAKCSPVCPSLRRPSLRPRSRCIGGREGNCCQFCRGDNRFQICTLSLFLLPSRLRFSLYSRFIVNAL